MRYGGMFVRYGGGFVRYGGVSVRYGGAFVLDGGVSVNSNLSDPHPMVALNVAKRRYVQKYQNIGKL